MQNEHPLAGRLVALPETRELDRLAALLEADGAETLRCPLVSILDAPDPAPVDAWLDTLVAGGFDDVIFLTGEGLRRLVSRATRAGRVEAVTEALARVRRITRGPKPARALHELKLSTDLPAAVPTTAGVIETLRPLDLRGRRVGVQLYGTEPNLPLMTFLAEAGAFATPVAPYIYAPASDETRVAALIDGLQAGRIDAIAFTSASQVDRLFQVAEARQLREALVEGLSKSLVASVGPVVAEALADRGVDTDVMPEKSFVMKRLTNALTAALGTTGAPAPGED
ncbi:MAG: uroporphyrinogen-III synthase [Myxococcales bacterium]|nr:uroporphyrinogen-III synthase [Myxococcales bacterium]